MTMEADDSVAKISSSTTDKINEAYTEERSKLAQFRLEQAPDTVYYLPEFITIDEERYLLERIENVPKPKWEYLSNRRLQNWGGVLGPKGLIPANDIPTWLRIYMNKICELGAFPQSNLPNHVLINEYLPGQGIMPHEDGPAFYPVISTISLGSHTILDFYRHISDHSNSMENVQFADFPLSERYVGSLLLEPRSLVIIENDLYKKFLHGIVERQEDILMPSTIWNLPQCKQVYGILSEGNVIPRFGRISLTIRNIPKVAKFDAMQFLFRSPQNPVNVL